MVRAVSRHHQTGGNPGGRIGRPPDAVDGRGRMIADVFCSPGGAAQLSSIMEEVPSWWRSAPCICANSAGLAQGGQETASQWAIDIGAGRSYKEIRRKRWCNWPSSPWRLSWSGLNWPRASRSSTAEHEAGPQGDTDGLTGIANRLALEDHLQEVCADAALQGAAWACCCWTSTGSRS